MAKASLITSIIAGLGLLMVVIGGGSPSWLMIRTCGTKAVAFGCDFRMPADTCGSLNGGLFQSCRYCAAFSVKGTLMGIGDVDKEATTACTDVEIKFETDAGEGLPDSVVTAMRKTQAVQAFSILGILFGVFGLLSMVITCLGKSSRTKHPATGCVAFAGICAFIAAGVFADIHGGDVAKGQDLAGSDDYLGYGYSFYMEIFGGLFCIIAAIGFAMKG